MVRILPSVGSNIIYVGSHGFRWDVNVVVQLYLCILVNSG
jgi:hypothetical protein